MQEKEPPGSREASARVSPEFRGPGLRRTPRNPAVFADYPGQRWRTSGRLGKKARQRREISAAAATFRLWYANRGVTRRRLRSVLARGGPRARAANRRRRKKRSEKETKKAVWPWRPATRAGPKGEAARRGKKVANVVKIRERQSGALCPAGEQYRRRSGDWRISPRIGRYCWIFQIVFSAYARYKNCPSATSPFGGPFAATHPPPPAPRLSPSFVSAILSCARISEAGKSKYRARTSNKFTPGKAAVFLDNNADQTL